MQVPKFKEYLTEAKGDKPFLRLLIITDEPEEAKTFHTADRLQEECDKLGYPHYLFKLTGGYTTFENGMPVHTKMTVSMLEDRIITKQDIEAGA